VPDIVADIFFVDEHLVHGPARPGPVKISSCAAFVKNESDLSFGLSALGKGSVDPADRLYFFGGTGDENHTVCLNAFVLTGAELAFRNSGLVDQFSPEAIAGHSPLPVSQLDQPT